jgi:chromate reductase
MLEVGIIVGSLSRSSINRKLATALARLAGGRFTTSFIRIDDLPLYNRDLDGDMPAPALRLKQAVAAADGLLLVTPEYLRSIPAALKNALEWGSRPYGRSSWGGKPAAIIGASPGAIGTTAAQQHLRNILSHADLSVMAQPEAFIQIRQGLIDDDHRVTDPAVQKFLETYLDRATEWIGQLRKRDEPATRAV